MLVVFVVVQILALVAIPYSPLLLPRCGVFLKRTTHYIFSMTNVEYVKEMALHALTVRALPGETQKLMNAAYAVAVQSRNSTILRRNMVSCQGCDGIYVVPPAEYDECGVCSGNSTCYGCDGAKWSLVEDDDCGFISLLPYFLR